MTHLEKVIFAIDNPHDIHQVACFTRFIDTQRALNRLTGGVVQCIGHWEGILEPSYMMNAVDYYEFVEKSGYVTNQICVLHVPGDTRQPCHTQTSYGMTENVGRMVKVDKSELNIVDPWTYVIKTEEYFQCL